jgi:hypothetical protein
MNNKTQIMSPVNNSHRASSVASVATVATVAGEAQDSSSKPFPVDALPLVMRGIVRAVAETLQVPHCLPGCCALATVSAAVGHLGIESWAGRVVGANLYIALGAASGAGKSETFRSILQPLLGIEAKAIERWKVETRPRARANQFLGCQEKKIAEAQLRDTNDPTEQAQIAARLAALEVKGEELNAELEPPVLLCEDITPERLEDLLSKNDEKLFSASPDAGAAIGRLLTKRPNVTIYVKAFSREYSRIDRVVRDKVALKAPSLSALWLMQPYRLDLLFNSVHLGESGFLPRLLACQAETQPLKIDSAVPKIPEQVLARWTNLIVSLHEAYYRSPSPPVLKCSKLTTAVLQEHQHRTVDRAAQMADAQSYIMRWNELAWKLTAVLHVGEHGASAGKAVVQSRTAKAAVMLLDWFAEQQLELLSKMRASTRRDREQAVFELFHRRPPRNMPRIVPPDSITARDLQQAHITNSASEAQGLLQQMESEGKILGKDHNEPRGGHRVRYYQFAQPPGS